MSAQNICTFVTALDRGGCPVDPSTKLACWEGCRGKLTRTSKTVKIQGSRLFTHQVARCSCAWTFNLTYAVVFAFFPCFSFPVPFLSKFSGLRTRRVDLWWVGSASGKRSPLLEVRLRANPAGSISPGRSPLSPRATADVDGATTATPRDKMVTPPLPVVTAFAARRSARECLRLRPGGGQGSARP